MPGIMGKKIALIIGAVMAGCVSPAIAKPRTSPYIVSDSAGFARCESACFGRRILVKNPTSRHVIVDVSCDGELLDISAIVLPRRSVVFDLGSGERSLEKGQCTIKSWKVWNGKSLQ